MVFFPYCIKPSEGASHEDGPWGPATRQEPQFVPETVPSEDEYKEAITLMKHSADEDTIKKKMKLTFDFRRNMVLDPQQSSNVLSVFPRFKDVKGLVIIFHYFDNFITSSGCEILKFSIVLTLGGTWFCSDVWGGCLWQVSGEMDDHIQEKVHPAMQKASIHQWAWRSPPGSWYSWGWHWSGWRCR